MRESVSKTRYIVQRDIRLYKFDLFADDMVTILLKMIENLNLKLNVIKTGADQNGPAVEISNFSYPELFSSVS